MKWYKRDPDAALAGMIGLTLEERGVYNTIIDLLYSRDGNLPSDDVFFARACECRPQVWRRVRDSLIAKGKLRCRADGKLTANRVEKELQTAGKLIVNPKEKPAVSDRKTNNINAPPPIAYVPQPQPHPERGSTGVVARARDLSSDAFELTLKIGTICGFADASFWPPGWAQAPRRIQQMLDQGWRAEIMIESASSIMQRKREKQEPAPDTISYFEKPFARAHAQQSAPLPVVEVSTTPEKVIVHEATGKHRFEANGSVGRGTFAERAVAGARRAAAAFGQTG